MATVQAPRARDRWTAALAIALPSAASAWSLGGPQLNADTILFSVMSHQKVTLFYWGQNRLANLVPALLWPVRDLNWNLAAVLLVHALGWHGLLWLVARAVQPERTREGTLPTYALLVALTHLLLTPEARYVLIAEGQPYALSYLALGLSWPWLVQRPMVLRKSLAGAALLAAGLGLNPGLVPAVGALAAATAGATRQWRRPAAALALAAVLTLLWQGLARQVGVDEGGHNYFAWQAADQKAHLWQVVDNIAAATRWPWLAAVLAGIGGLLPWTLLGRRTLAAPTRWLTAGLALLAGAWLLLFSSNAWVLTNHLHFKYFFPIFLALIWGLALLLAQAVELTRERLQGPPPRHLTLPAAAVLLLACPALGGEARWKVQSFNALDNAQGVLKRLPRQPGPLLVGGDYWRVWPVVHQALQRGQQAFGTAERGTAMRDELKNLLPSQGDDNALGYVCLAAAVPRCLADLAQLTARPWQVQAQQPCGRDCQWLRVGSPQKGWTCPAQLGFATGGNVPVWATAGLGEPEPHGRWTVRPQARLTCRWPDQRPPRAIRLTASAFLPAGVPRQRLIVGPTESEGQLAVEWTVGQAERTVDVALELALDGTVALHLQLPDAVAPATLGLSGDPRPLALSLRTGQWIW